MKRTYLEGIDGLRQEVERVVSALGVDVEVTVAQATIFNGEGVNLKLDIGEHVIIAGEFLIDRRPSGKFTAFQYNDRHDGYTRIKKPSGERIESDAELRFVVVTALQVFLFKRGSRLSKNKLLSIAEERTSPPEEM